MLRRTDLALALALASIGCEGVLREKPTGLSDDAGPLGAIDPPPCDPPAAPAGDGHHLPGEDCLGCHHQGGMDMAPPFTLAGTLFTGPGGIEPAAGSTLHLIDALGSDVVVTAAANGNFYSTELVVFPVIAFASACPDVEPMITPVGDLDASCNRTGCHSSGFRVH